MRSGLVSVVGLLLGFALLTTVSGQDNSDKSPVEQAQLSGLPLLTEFTVQVGGTGTTYVYDPPQPGPQRLIAAWGARAELFIRVRAGERAPLQATGNPASIRFNAEAGQQYTIGLGPMGDLPVTSVGLLYGGPEAEAKPTKTPETPGQTPKPGRTRPGRGGRGAAVEPVAEAPKVGGGAQPLQPAQDVQLSVLQIPAVAALQQAGITRLGELAPRVSTRAGLEALSRDTGVPAEHLLFLAEDAQLSALLGGQKVDAQQIAALQRLDITRPEQLARFAGREAELGRLVGRQADSLQTEAPTLTRMQQWTAAVGKQVAVLPDMKVFRPEQPTPRDAKPGSPLLFGEDGAELISNPVPGGGVQGLTLLGTIMQPGIVITPDKEYILEFPVGAGGLYRLDYNLQRKGGFATVAWSIEKPVGKLLQLPGDAPKPIGGNQQQTVLDLQPKLAGGVIGFETMGWQPIIQGGQPLETIPANAADNLALFWVKSKDIGYSRTLRLRLTVLTSKAAGGVADATGIEQGLSDDDAAAAKDSTVRGQVRVLRVAPKHLSWGSPEPMWFNSARETAVLTPVRVFEASRISRTPLGENPWGLTLKLTPTPNTYAPHLVRPNTGTPSQYNEGQRYGGQVVCDDVPVAGEWTTDWGVASFSSANPRSGAYYVLLGPRAYPQCFEDLSTAGMVVGRWEPGKVTGPTQLEDITADLQLQGGGNLPGSAYVAEITEVRASGQSEANKFGESNDEGLGEFTLEATAVFAGRGEDDEDEYQGKHVEPLTASLTFPTDCTYFQMPGRGVGDIRMFPRCPIGWWPADEVNKRDSLVIAARMFEHDDVSGWAVLKALGGVFSKLVETIVAAWKGDASGFASGMKGYVEAIVNQAPLDGADDLTGYPGLGTTRVGSEYGFVAEEDPNHPSPDEVTFDATGPTDLNKLLTPGLAGVGGHTLGYVTANAGDTSWAALRTRIRRNVPVLWSWAEVQLLDFTVSADLDAGEDMQSPPMEVYVTGGYGGSGGYKWNPYFRRNIWGSENEGKGYNFKFWDWDVNANEKVVVRQPAPPQARQEGGVLQPPSIEQTIQAVPYTYAEIGLWDADPGPDDFIGLFSRTFYHDEIRRLATDPSTAGQWMYSGVQTANPSRMKCMKEGPYYTCEIIAHNTGNWLDEVHVKAWVYIWEG